MKKTVVIGATDRPDRYAYKATVALTVHKHEVVPVGLRTGEINGIRILKDYPPIENVDTVTMYVGTLNQKSWYDYILSLKPKRVIFNPGTENDELYALLEKNNIEYVEGCTLVMLAIGNY